MPSSSAAAVDAVLRVTMAHADSVITATNRAGQQAQRELLRDLAAADKLLSERLARFGDSTEQFTAASLVSYQEQVRAVTDVMRRSMMQCLGPISREAWREGLAKTRELLVALDRAFTGIARPLRLRQASVMSAARRGQQASLLRQRRASVDRYGVAMIRDFETLMRQGLIAGLSQAEMVAQLVGRFGLRQSWAWRIVRTEVARAYSVARQESLVEQQQEIPELQKKILATFDNRTAPDSVGVHGQVRKVSEPFVDGAGRVYMQPPARPNDREVVIPWLPEWGETPITRSIAPAARAGMARARNPQAVATRLAEARSVSARERR